MPKAERIYSDLALNIFGYQEDRAWVALALEMDLRGDGPTFNDALDELDELVTTQLGFAQMKAQPELIWKPAEPIYWRLFEDARRDRLREFVLSESPRNPDYEVRGLPLPPPHVITSLPEFQQADG
jgi:hypothetical protein